MKKNQLKKYYVTNGYNKKIFTTRTPKEAAISIVNYIMGAETNEEDERFELYPFSVISECGFLSDLLAEEIFEEIDNCVAVKTSNILKILGRDDIAKEMIKFEKKLPAAMKKLLKSLEQKEDIEEMETA